MSFSQEFDAIIASPSALVQRFLAMLQPCSAEQLEQMARQAAAITRRHFGRTMRMYAPVYVSNECVNNCTYCGFSRDNPIVRLTLSVDKVEQEARFLYNKGMRSILLVAGEHPKFVSEGYLQECLRRLRTFIPSLSIEVGPMEEHQYAEIVACGAENLVVYQETYNKQTYAKLHTAGPKKNFDFRLDCPERASKGGFRRVGIGALLGLHGWLDEVKALACHLEYLQKHCWTTQFSVSFPRMRPYAGNYQYTPDERLMLDDARFVQLICATRICFPHVAINMSTREPAWMRDALVPLGITQMSAGARTQPGGYTGAPKSDLHITQRGRQLALPQEIAASTEEATEQFRISDERSIEQVAARLRELGFEPVWKDWEQF